MADFQYWGSYILGGKGRNGEAETPGNVSLSNGRRVKKVDTRFV